jgi:hypothetical protein
MVIAEICNGEVPYDTQECRQMSLDAFITSLREGNRPQLCKEFAQCIWLQELVSSTHPHLPRSRGAICIREKDLTACISTFSVRSLSLQLQCAWSFDASQRCTSSDMYLKFVEHIG